MAENKTIKVDFSDKQQNLPKGKVSKLDPTQDSFAIPAPPPKGMYDLKLALAKEGIVACPIDKDQEISDDNVYYRASLECPIVNSPEFENKRVFPMVSTLIGRGKELSTMADLIVRAGYGKNLKAEMSDYDVALLFSKVCEKEPVFKGCECDWEGYSKDENDGKGKTVLKTMTDFPEDGKGGYKHIVAYKTSKRTTEEIVAQLKVKKWPMANKPVTDGGTATATASKPAASVTLKRPAAKKQEEPVEPVVSDSVEDDLLS